MVVYVKGTPIEIPRGPAGIDGNPVGTVISFMGNKAPYGYLLCDGTIYNIDDYKSLTNHFQAQFGRSNYFGGNGTTTFAVPDLRNQFLRGYHGSTTAYSGNIGVKQNGTVIPNLGIGGSSSSTNIFAMTERQTAVVKVANYDVYTTTNEYTAVNSNNIFTASSATGTIKTYTPRPMNVAVLFCIKAGAPGEGPEDVYSTDEMMVGTWTDGSPIYRRVFFTNTGASGWTQIQAINNGEDIDQVIRLEGIIKGVAYSSFGSNLVDVRFGGDGMSLGFNQGTHAIWGYTNTYFTNKECFVVFEYTKKSTSAASIPMVIPEIDFEVDFDVTEIASTASSASSAPTIRFDEDEETDDPS